MRKHASRRFWFRSAAFVLIPAHVALSAPAFADAAAIEAAFEAAEAAKVAAAPPPPPEVKVNRTVPRVTPPPAYPVFSLHPTTEEITRARVFGEPLLPVSGIPTSLENDELARAITAWLQGGVPEATGFFEEYLVRYPASPWRASLAANLGVVYERHGYFGRAEKSLRLAWDLARESKNPTSSSVAHFAVGELLDMYMQFGQVEEIESTLAQITSRDVRGPAVDQITYARAAAWGLRNAHESAIPSAAVALDRMHALARPGEPRPEAVSQLQATHTGASLDQVEALAQEIDLPLEAAFRPSGTEIVTPAIVHLKRGHFATIVREEAGRFVLDDPLLGGEVWLSKEALEEEASGYFLVPAGPLPAGWSRPDAQSARNVRGKCQWVWPFPIRECGPRSKSCCFPKKGGSGGKCGGGSCRMAEYSFNNLHGGLHITDSPVGYTPPRGPAVEFKVNYNQRGATQPTNFSFANFGSAWAPEWVAYIEDDPANPSAPATYVTGGGKSTYSGFSGGQYTADPDNHSLLVRTSSSPIRYERRLSDASVEVFETADGAATYPRRIFMTQWIDPQGNGVSFSYDAQLRLVAITDAIGQVSSLFYDLVSDPLKVTRISDPFGRTAKFAYTPDGHLQSITDVIGIVSSFEYNGDFIQALTTPYGTTTFNSVYYYDPLGHSPGQWIEAKDPLGGRERSELAWSTPAIPNSDPASNVPTGFLPSNTALSSWNTFYWDKRAMALHPGDPTKSLITKWLHSETWKLGPYKHSEKLPLESRVWYAYAGNPAVGWVGQERHPSTIARVLDDGTTQSYRYEYNVKGLQTRVTDPLGRETVYEYGTDNIDLLRIEQRNPASPGAYDLIGSLTYNSLHQPLMITDSAGQVTTYTYNAQGQILTVTTPPRTGITENRTTTITYDPSGYVQSVSRPATGATTSYTYDGYGRVRTETDPDHTLTYDYDVLDRPTRVTYPDGSYARTQYNRLEAERYRDRLGRWTHTFHDSLRRPVAQRDPLGRTITQEWCTCGSLDRIIDANGNARTWERDLQGRKTREIRADATATGFSYENTTSRLKQVIDAKSQNVELHYFIDNNLKQITYTNAAVATPAVTFAYDTSYDRLVRMTDGTGNTAYAYHAVTAPPALGATRLASIDGPLPNDTMSYVYDELGRAVTTSINGVASTQGFDALGRMISLTNALGAFAYSYVGTTGRLNEVLYPGGQATTYGYLDHLNDHRLKEIHNKISGGTTLSKATYSTDLVGRVTTWTQQIGGSAPTVYDYEYDAADQLTAATLKATSPPGVLKTFGYGYDKAGNRTLETVDNSVVAANHNSVNRLLTQQPGGALRFSGTVNEPATVTLGGNLTEVTADNRFAGSVPVGLGSNSVAVAATDASGNTRTNTYQVGVSGSSQSFTYDLNGNLVADGSRTYEWDGANRLVAINTGTKRSEFGYDGVGRRARVVDKDNGVVTSDKRFVWCDTSLCEERDVGGSVVTRRFFGEGVQEGGQAYFYTRDHLGSVRELTDATGAVRARYDYDPYGRLTKLAGDKESLVTYAGLYSHGPSGLQLALLRVYDPSLGRWLSEDPIGVAGGLNVYEYGASNPINAVDPLGLQAQPVPADPIPLTKPPCRVLPFRPPPVPPVPPLLIGLLVFGAVMSGGSSNLPTSDLDELYNPEVCGPKNEKCNANKEPKKGCKPCIPPVGTIAYRADTDPKSRPHRGVPPPHWKLYVMMQNPNNCQCFWHPIPDNQGGFGGGEPPPGIPEIGPASGGGFQ